jgi:hypothetical protein
VSTTIVALRPEHFAEPEKLLVTHGEMTASTFRYSTGVEGLRIRNAAGHIDLLPFQGQQIWDAVFHGRSLTMGSMFPEPRTDVPYLGTYGAFFIHCGMTAMGNPGQGDAHPLHGELPNARFETADLVVGEEDGKPFMTLTGSWRYAMAFATNYVATPRITFRGGDSFVHIDLSIRNLMRKPMELMYLAHINFRPVDGSTIIDAVPDDLEHIKVRTALPSNFSPTEAHKKLLADVLADPAVHRKVGYGADPELVMTLKYPADAAGWAETMQRHPDGTADFVRHRPGELPKGVRWTTRSGDQEALGFVLPATAEPDGYTAEKAKGHVLSLAAGAEWTCSFDCGVLDAAGATAMQERIAKVKAG